MAELVRLRWIELLGELYFLKSADMMLWRWLQNEVVTFFLHAGCAVVYHVFNCVLFPPLHSHGNEDNGSNLQKNNSQGESPILLAFVQSSKFGDLSIQCCSSLSLPHQRESSIIGKLMVRCQKRKGLQAWPQSTSACVILQLKQRTAESHHKSNASVAFKIKHFLSVQGYQAISW